jgi:hypothetical protein
MSLTAREIKMSRFELIDVLIVFVLGIWPPRVLWRNEAGMRGVDLIRCPD